MFVRVPVIISLPLLCSSQIDSHPSKNTLYQQNTVARHTADTPWTFWIISNVFVALEPVFQQKWIASHCSIVFSVTIYDTDKTDKLRHIANMYLTVNGSSWNLACMEKRICWQTSPSFKEIALLVLCFHSVVVKLTGQTWYFNIYFVILQLGNNIFTFLTISFLFVCFFFFCFFFIRSLFVHILFFHLAACQLIWQLLSQ